MPTREPSRPVAAVQAVTGGLVTVLAFPDTSWWPAGLLGVTLLVLSWRRGGPRWGAVGGFLWGLAFFLPLLHWLDVSVGAVPWFALSVAEALFVAGLGAVWAVIKRGELLRRHPYALAAVFGAAWAVMEQLRSVVPFGGFPWGRLAFSQVDAPVVALATIGGVPLVSGVVAFAAAVLARAWVDVRLRRLGSAAVALAVAGGVVLVGALVPLPGAGTTAGESGTLRLAAVQGNVARPGLDAFSTRREVLTNHADGTAALLDRVAPGYLDVVLWPENAADLDPRTDAQAAALVDGAAVAVQAPILVGTLRYDVEGRYNEAILWVPGVGPVASYTKQHPAPFAEYIPLRPLARLFSDKVDLVRTDMLPGTDVGVIPLDVPRLGRTVPLADVICFEVAYDEIVRAAVLAGGEMIVVQTNNASFGRTPESTQQLAMTRFRAVEHGRAAVQISTVGVSAVVAPDGTIVSDAGLFTADQLVGVVPLRTSLTLSDRLGHAPIWVAAALTAAAFAAGLVAGRRRARARDVGRPAAAPPVPTRSVP